MLISEPKPRSATHPAMIGERAHERFAGRRRRRRAVLLASGSPLGASACRSIRMTGRMITAADADLSAIGFGARAARPAA
jgi:hypothetical protein